MEKKEAKKREKRLRLNEIIPDDAIRNEMLTRLYKGDPILGEKGVFTNLLQSFVNAALEGEMDNFLQEAKDDSPDNRRNGHTSKSLRSTAGSLSIQTPRDRSGDHEPVIVKKRERELGTGLDEIILSLYSRGQSVEDVRIQLHKIYGLEVSPGAISAVTDRIWSEIIEWQQRPLATCKAPGAYKVVTVDNLGCLNSSNIITVISSKVLTVYPNPASVNFTLRLKGAISGKAVISIYSAAGLKVAEVQAENFNEELIKEIAVNNLDNGVYVVQVLVNQQELYYTKMIVKK
jgi:hypothetical protein